MKGLLRIVPNMEALVVKSLKIQYKWVGGRMVNNMEIV